MSYHLHRAEGIVLGSFPCGEADKMVILFTKEFGLVRVFAKGVRLEKSKLRGHLCTGTHVAVGFVMGKEMKRLTHASVAASFGHIQNDMFRFRGVQAVFRLVEEGMVEDEPDTHIWDIVHQVLTILGAEGMSQGDVSLVLSAFRLKLFSIGGYLPEERPPVADMLFRSSTLLPPVHISESSRIELREFLDAIQAYAGRRVGTGNSFLIR